MPTAIPVPGPVPPNTPQGIPFAVPYDGPIPLGVTLPEAIPQAIPIGGSIPEGTPVAQCPVTEPIVFRRIEGGPSGGDARAPRSGVRGYLKNLRSYWRALDRLILAGRSERIQARRVGFQVGRHSGFEMRGIPASWVEAHFEEGLVSTGWNWAKKSRTHLQGYQEAGTFAGGCPTRSSKRRTLRTDPRTTQGGWHQFQAGRH